MAAPPIVPTADPPVAAEPIAPPATAPPTVPTVSPLDAHALRPAVVATARIAATRCLLMGSPCKKWSGAAAQQKDHEQHRDRHAECPQQDVAELSLLLATACLKLFHKKTSFAGL